MVDAFEKLGNPWKVTNGLLYELNESIVVPAEVAENVHDIRKIGEAIFQKFLLSRRDSESF